MLGRGLGSMRVDGTRNGKLLSLEISCHTRGWMAEWTHRWRPLTLAPTPTLTRTRTKTRTRAL